MSRQISILPARMPGAYPETPADPVQVTEAHTQTQLGLDPKSASFGLMPQPSDRKAKILQVLQSPSDLVHYLDKKDSYHLAAVFPEAAPDLLGATFHRRQIAATLQVPDAWLLNRLQEVRQETSLGHLFAIDFLPFIHQSLNKVPRLFDNQPQASKTNGQIETFLKHVSSDINDEWHANEKAFTLFKQQFSATAKRSAAALLEGCVSATVIINFAAMAWMATQLSDSAFLASEGRQHFISSPLLDAYKGILARNTSSYTSVTGYRRSSQLLYLTVISFQSRQFPHILRTLKNDLDELKNHWSLFNNTLNTNALTTLIRASKSLS